MPCAARHSRIVRLIALICAVRRIPIDCPTELVFVLSHIPIGRRFALFFAERRPDPIRQNMTTSVETLQTDPDSPVPAVSAALLYLKSDRYSCCIFLSVSRSFLTLSLYYIISFSGLKVNRISKLYTFAIALLPLPARNFIKLSELQFFSRILQKSGMFHVEHSVVFREDCASFLRICADIEQEYQRLSEVQSDIYPHPQADRIFRLQPSSQALQRLHETAPVHGHTVGLS